MAPSKNAAGGTELAVRKADPVSKVEIDLLGDEVASIPQTAVPMPPGLNDVRRILITRRWLLTFMSIAGWA